MKKTALVIGGLAATILVSGWTLAQSDGYGPGAFGRGGMQGMHGKIGAGMHGQMGPGMQGYMGRGEHAGPASMFGDPARLEAVKTEIGITAAQEPAWTKYAQAIQDVATTMKTTHEGIDHDAVSKMSPTERSAFASAIREQMHKQFETVQAAATELLATLDDTQKAKAEELLPGLAHGHGARHGARMGGVPQQN